MTRAELTPAGVMCPEAFLMDFLFLLNPFPPPFSSTAWRSSLYLLTGVLGGIPLPSLSSPPSTDFHVPTQSLLPSTRSCQVFPLNLVFPSSLVWGRIISLVRHLSLQPL